MNWYVIVGTVLWLLGLLFAISLCTAARAGDECLAHSHRGAVGWRVRHSPT